MVLRWRSQSEVDRHPRSLAHGRHRRRQRIRDRSAPTSRSNPAKSARHMRERPSRPTSHYDSPPALHTPNMEGAFFPRGGMQIHISSRLGWQMKKNSILDLKSWGASSFRPGLMDDSVYIAPRPTGTVPRVPSHPPSPGSLVQLLFCQSHN